jgi:hypothetical protein
MEFISFLRVEISFISVFTDNVVVVLNLIIQGVSSLGEGVLLVGEVIKFMVPSILFSVFPALVSGSGGGDLLLESRNKFGNLGKELWVA